MPCEQNCRNQETTLHNETKKKQTNIYQELDNCWARGEKKEQEKEEEEVEEGRNMGKRWRRRRRRRRR